MTGYAAIMLSTSTFGSVLASLSDTPGGEARFMHACLVYPYNGENVYFIRGNFKEKSGYYSFDDHLLTEAQLSEIFDWTSPDGIQKRYATKPDGEWFAVFTKGSHQIDTLYDKEGMVIMRRQRGELLAYLKKSGRYLNCFVQVHESAATISVRKYKGEFNGERVLDGKAAQGEPGGAGQAERPDRVH